MKLVEQNPYRIVGLIVGASAREQERQTRRLKQFIEAEQEPQEDFSFPVLGQLNRTIENVNDASSKLNLGNDKISAALFWFFDGSHTDEPAFDAIKANDTHEAIRVWGLKTSERDVLEYNLSAFSNISTLMLHAAFKNDSINENVLEKGIRYKLKFIESDFVKSFIKLATDDNFKISKKELQLLFLNQVQSEIEKSSGLSTSKFIEIINKQEFTAKDDFLKGYIQKPIEQIEKEIETGKTNRKKDKTNSIVIGKKILFETVNDHALLKSILGTSNIKFVSISDKIADEVLQCGIDYFNHYIDTDFDPGPAALDLCKKAKSFALGNVIKTRCEETIVVIQKWVDNKPERDKEKRIANDLDNLKNLIDQYETKSETIANARQYLNLTRSHLNNIKSVLGTYDELYINFSTRVASDAQSMCVSEINKLQDNFTKSYDSAIKAATFLLLQTRVNEAWELTNVIGAMDLRSDFRVRFNENKSALSSLKDNITPKPTPPSNGCYIATMAYGDYSHPQVMILRQFRDEVLDKSVFGKWFIKIYYHYSPKLVEKLKNKKTINIIIRKSLNQFIKLIK